MPQLGLRHEHYGQTLLYYSLQSWSLAYLSICSQDLEVFCWVVPLLLLLWGGLVQQRWKEHAVVDVDREYFAQQHVTEAIERKVGQKDLDRQLTEERERER